MPQPGSKSKYQLLTDEVRTKFLNSLDTNSETYCPEDIQRVQEDNWFVKRFVLHNNLDTEKALKYLKEALKWRKQYNVRGLTYDSIPKDVLDLGLYSQLGKDKKGLPIVLVRLKAYQKSKEIVENARKLMVLYAEHFEKDSNGGQLTILFDCSDAGRKNVDMDFALFIVSCFQNYYPRCLGRLLVYDMHWVFNTAWKVIKPVLPSAASRIVKFVDKNSIKEYIDLEELPTYMGGKKFVNLKELPSYRFVDLPSEVPPEEQVFEGF